MRRELPFLGIRFADLTLPEALDEVFAKATQLTFSYIVTPNVAHVVELDAEVRAGEGRMPAAYHGAALRVCDSRILALLARRSGITLPVVPGSDLTASLLADPRLGRQRVAIVGSTPEALAALRHQRPDVDFVQMVPPMGVRSDPAAQANIVAFVETESADVVLFALGAPQSELLALTLAERGRARGVGLCIGASIDFVIGAKRRAPKLLQKLHLEWAHRLASEPRRLWRRYLVEGPRIVVIWRKWQSAHMIRGSRAPG